MYRIKLLLAGLLLMAALPASLNAQDADTKAVIKDALSAATDNIAKGATVVDWENNVLKEGDNGWVCLPTPPGFAKGAMCLDEPWLVWADAWQNKKDFSIDRVGISYMLAGDSGASNSDPHATGETDDWVETGAHLMIIVPDASMLEGMSTDPDSGGPWVMWSGTPYAHIMVPVE